MQSSGAARRYARALFSLAQEDGSVSAVRQQLDALADLLVGNDELRHAIFRPLPPSKERRAVLEGVCSRLDVSDTLTNFCAFSSALDLLNATNGVLFLLKSPRRNVARRELRVNALTIKPVQVQGGPGSSGNCSCRPRWSSAARSRTGRNDRRCSGVGP